MNLLLLEPDEVTTSGEVRLAGRRLLHAREILGVEVGASIRVGVRGGQVGQGEVVSISEQEMVVRVLLSEAPPRRPGIDLLLAFPRPKALRRIFPAIASFGIDRVVLVNAAQVEKSYFASPLIAADSVRELFSLGMEQARDTVAPELIVEPRFRPFVEDRLDSMFPDSRRLLAHPGTPSLLTRGSEMQRTVLAVGPDGGWVPFELELLRARGFQDFSLGERPLRTEVAIPALLGALLSKQVT